MQFVFHLYPSAWLRSRLVRSHSICYTQPVTLRHSDFVYHTWVKFTCLADCEIADRIRCRTGIIHAIRILRYAKGIAWTPGSSWGMYGISCTYTIYGIRIGHVAIALTIFIDALQRDAPTCIHTLPRRCILPLFALACACPGSLTQFPFLDERYTFASRAYTRTHCCTLILYLWGSYKTPSTHVRCNASRSRDIRD